MAKENVGCDGVVLVDGVGKFEGVDGASVTLVSVQHQAYG